MSRTRNVIGRCHTAAMPKLRHEAVVEILQNEPELILQLLAGAGVHLPFGTYVAAPPERIRRYTGYLKALVPPSIREPLETMMKTVFKDPWVDGLLNQGRVEMLLELLKMRFSVPDDIRMRVEKCTDETQIKTWFRRVPSATSLDEVFAELRSHPLC